MKKLKDIVDDIRKDNMNFYTATCIRFSEIAKDLDIDKNEIYDMKNDIVYSFESEEIAKKVLDYSIKISNTGIDRIKQDKGIDISSFVKKV